MAIKTLTEKDPKARYRVCVEGKGNKAVKATCDTLDDVAKYLADNGKWVFVAQGIQVLEIDHDRVAIHDRDVEHRSYDGEKLLIFGKMPNSRDFTQKSDGTNPCMDD